MPPKAKISREMIVEAGLGIVREEGLQSLNVRRIAAALHCSTQPVMYHYSTVSALKADVYAAADALHTAFITEPDDAADNPLLSIGLRYLRFAAEEKHLFRFLFQSNQFQNTPLRELIEEGGGNPVIQPLCACTGLDEAQAKEVFATLFLCVHGAASLIANNSLAFDAAYFTNLLERALNGAAGTYLGGQK